MSYPRTLCLAAAAAVAAVIPFSAAAAGHAVLHFKVVSAKVTATLTFHTSNNDATETSDGKILFSATPKGTGKGAFPGRITFPMKGLLSERVVTTHKPSDTSPYQETCKNGRKIGGSGGIVLTRVGSSVEARWAFPQATPSFCTGPRAGKNITTRMARLFSTKLFNSTHPVVTIAGSGKSKSGSTSLSYRWSAVVKLARS